MNQKSLTAITGVVVVILIGTTVYFSTIKNNDRPVTQIQPTHQTTNVVPIDESLKWTIYEINGYSFKYPSKLYVPKIKGNESIGFGDEGFVFESVLENGELGDINGPDYFYVDSGTNSHMTIEGMEKSLKLNYDTVSKNSWMLGDEAAEILIAERVAIPNETKSAYNVHIFLKEKHRMEISFWGKPKDDIIKTIISSFKWNASQN